MSSDYDTALVFLETGAAIVAERGIGHALPPISTNELLELAPGDLTRGAFTHIWSRRGDFDRDLYRYLAEGIKARARARLDESAGGAIAGSKELAPLDVMLRKGLEHAVATMRASDDFHMFNALWSYAEHDDEIKRLLDETSEISQQAFTEQLKLLLAVYRLRMKPGRDIPELATALLAMTEGSVVRRPLASETPDYMREAHAEAVVAIAMSMTEPI